ncbi:MAG: hypothetical protein ACSHXZ_13710 [Gammaproteobacteria bacterium]
MKEQQKLELLMLHLDEEASILEIFRALCRQSDTESPEQSKQWIMDHIMSMAEGGTLGFYIDEFGARDVVECDIAQARELLAQEDVWALSSETMLHIYPIS